MNIDIKNLDFSLSRSQVVEFLTTILHRAPFRPSADHLPMNFHVQLHKATNLLRNNRGTGLLTLPTVESGQLLLQRHGSKQPKIPLLLGHGRVINFFHSSKQLGPETVDKIRLLPFSWEEEKREQWHIEHDSADLKVNLLQFGWICRDYTFSVECEESCYDRCHVKFNNERREIRIHLCLITGFYLVVISFASIITVSTSTNLDRESALVFYLSTPPSYEMEQAGGKRLKLSHLPVPEHERVAPFASNAIRIVCGSNKDIRQFRRLCNIAHLNKVDEYDYPVDHRELFALTDMFTMQDQLHQLPWIVAFQMEALFRKAIDFKEAIALYPMVLQAIEDEGEEFVASALRNLRNRAEELFDFQDEVAMNVVELFRKIVEELSHEGTFAFPRPIDGSLYQAFHVNVTPTTMHLDGPFPEQSNRVIRAFGAEHQDCFLRVCFVDESHLQYRLDHEIDSREFIKSRIGPLFYNGLKIAGRRFDFLAYSQSALKEHAVWWVRFFMIVQ